MTTILLDTHVVYWLSAQTDRLSGAASEALDDADELAVASVSWYELAWLAHRRRIEVDVPIRAWMEGLAAALRTVPTTPAIATTAVALPSSFPGDPADRVIYATAIEMGWPLVTKDQALRRHRHRRRITIW